MIPVEKRHIIHIVINGHLAWLADIVSAEEDVDAVEAVDAVAGRQDPLVGEQGAAAEVGVGALHTLFFLLDCRPTFL
jgi:hypothetical protein